VSTILSCGALPVTAVSDVLKPGGYSRMVQYLENLERDMEEKGATSLEELARDRLASLDWATAHALDEERYKKRYHPYELPKVETGLELFDCVAAPCRYQCAVLQDVPEYAWLIAQGAYDRALEVVLYRNPLPNVTGYVCDHLCQTRCTRSNYDDPVAIRALKRFAAEKGSTAIEAAVPSGKRAAIIGAGPSGLAAAYFLALSGVSPVIHEAREEAGGMPAIAPEFRLPRRVVREDVERIKRLGAEIRVSQAVAEPPEAFLERGFDAVYIAPGAQKDARLGIEGEDGESVYHALDLLERVKRGEEIPMDGDVLVIGGGNTAMDAARTARRLTDGQVTVVYRRTEAEMPADEEEIEAILAEGIAVEELASPTRIVLEEGRVVALECVRNELGEPGRDGRPRPVIVEGSEFWMEADGDRDLQVVVAIGQRPDIAFLDESGVGDGNDETIGVDPETGRVVGWDGVDQKDGRVFAGGDVARGPATIIKACRDGERAAEAICEGLDVTFRRLEIELPTLSAEEILGVKRVRARREARHDPPMLPPEERGGFDLVEQTLPEDAARAEAERCVQCSQLCDKCVEVCPNRANYTYLISPVAVTMPTLACVDDALRVVGGESFRVVQGRQILHVDDFCNECGNCSTFCVHDGRPFADKPRLFLNEDDFGRETDNAFYIERAERGWVIRRREGGEESRLTLEAGEGGVTFENRWLSVQVGPGSAMRSMTLKEGFEGVFSLSHAAEMVVILEGVLRTLPFVLAGQG
ncbi:MAG: FAD-dependent oxidoreductase, partial [Chloroflexota bacterium]